MNKKELIERLEDEVNMQFIDYMLRIKWIISSKKPANQKMAIFDSIFCKKCDHLDELFEIYKSSKAL